MEARIVQNLLRERAHLFASGKFAVDYQIRRFDERRIFGKHFDWNTPIAENALFAVDVGNFALARTRVCETLIERDIARLRAQFGNVYGLVARRALYDGELVSFLV